MKMTSIKYSRYFVVISLIIVLALIPVVGIGCAGSPKVSGILASEISKTQVPNLNLDLYLNIKQESPIIVPRDLTGSANDISIDSLAIWGIVDQNTYSVSGALTFTNAIDANNLYSQLPKMADVWTKLSARTIYVVYGSGGPADSLKTAISNNDFKQFDDTGALGEISLMPYGATTKPSAIGMIRPSPAAMNLLKQYVDANTMTTIDSINTWVKPQVFVFGLYSSQPIVISDINQRILNNTVWDTELGVVASCVSSFPGIVFSPIASSYLDNTGYPKSNVGSLPVYKISLDGGNGKIIPLLINVNGNHVFATSSGRESYADTLMTGITR
jgi:hypothetical protein